MYACIYMYINDITYAYLSVRVFAPYSFVSKYTDTIVYYVSKQVCQ